MKEKLLVKAENEKHENVKKRERERHDEKIKQIRKGKSVNTDRDKGGKLKREKGRSIKI